jgi:hypothetical protein
MLTEAFEDAGENRSCRDTGKSAGAIRIRRVTRVGATNDWIGDDARELHTLSGYGVEDGGPGGWRARQRGGGL